jgi:hypothetical protein
VAVPEDRRSSAGYGAATTVGGAVLVGLGLLLFVQQAFGFDFGHYGWPLFILLPGLALLGGFAVGGRGAAGLAIPGCVVTMVGLLLAIQNTFDIWQTWAYAWGLIVAAVGLGLRLMGERLGQPRPVVVGTYLLEGGVFAFVVFAVFFELILGLSSVGAGALRGTFGPALLILAGLYLLLRRHPRAL